MVNNNRNQMLKEFCWSSDYSSQIIVHYAKEYRIETIGVINTQLSNQLLKLLDDKTADINGKALQTVNNIMRFKTATTKNVFKGSSGNVATIIKIFYI